MNENIKSVVTEEAVEGVANHSGLRKGAVIVMVTGAITTVGYLAYRFVVKPITKKIRAKKALKNQETKHEIPQTNFVGDDDLDDDVPMIFDENEEE